MGSLFGGRISNKTSYVQNPTNPNPLNFVVELVVEYKNYVIAKVHYIGCTNFEGRKILVLEDITVQEFNALNELDPHFALSSKLIARFKPTEEGWAMALMFVKNLENMYVQ